MSKKARKFIVYFCILLFPLLFIYSNQVGFKSFRMGTVELTSLPLRVLLFPFKEFRKILLYHFTYNKYMSLQEEVDHLKSEILTQEESLKENQRLKQLLDFKSKASFPTIAAKVIGRDAANWTSMLYIDKGRRHGIRVGMPVVNAISAVGRVSAVGSDISKVMLLSDPNFSVAGVIDRSRETGVVSGTLKPVCRMRYLSEQADVQVGDRVITSKLSSFFPEGLIIGEVTDVFKSPSSPMLECMVKPAFSPSQIEEVLIIKQ